MVSIRLRLLDLLALVGHGLGRLRVAARQGVEVRTEAGAVGGAEVDHFRSQHLGHEATALLEPGGRLGRAGAHARRGRRGEGRRVLRVEHRHLSRARDAAAEPEEVPQGGATRVCEAAADILLEAKSEQVHAQRRRVGIAAAGAAGHIRPLQDAGGVLLRTLGEQHHGNTALGLGLGFGLGGGFGLGLGLGLGFGFGLGLELGLGLPALRPGGHLLEAAQTHLARRRLREKERIEGSGEDVAAQTQERFGWLDVEGAVGAGADGSEGGAEAARQVEHVENAGVVRQDDVPSLDASAGPAEALEGGAVLRQRQPQLPQLAVLLGVVNAEHDEDRAQQHAAHHLSRKLLERHEETQRRAEQQAVGCEARRDLRARELREELLRRGVEARRDD
mmetsp:Transcript_41792/g.130907  ORF Transcript_41792/g.130907 Transcript_41792/m.130907 type:complete len:390 (+) Transcript_41792:37-1206(+)